MILAIFAVTTAVTAQRKPRGMVIEPKLSLGPGMDLINADLMQIAIQTDFFLQFSKEINLTVRQEKQLEEMYFEIQKYNVRRQTDLDVADAELRRLMNTERVDLTAVREKVKEIEALQVEATMKKIEAVLQAINTLTHEQHLNVMRLVRQMLKQELPNSDG